MLAAPGNVEISSVEGREKDPLLEKSQIQERPFLSGVPLLGGLIAWLRTRWNNVATTGYVRPLLVQQNEFNRLMVTQLHEHDAWLITQDREQTTLRRETAVIVTQTIQLQRRLHGVDQRLRRLETRAQEKGSEGTLS